MPRAFGSGAPVVKRRRKKRDRQMDDTNEVLRYGFTTYRSESRIVIDAAKGVQS